jgi:hypothetical protein
MFLDSIRERQEEEERQRKEKDGVEVMDFKKYVHWHTTHSMAVLICYILERLLHERTRPITLHQ